MKIHKFYLSPILFIGICVSAEENFPARAPPLRSTYIHINGLRYHFDASSNANDFLYGEGFHYDWFYIQDSPFSFLNRIMIALEADILNDSQHHWTYAAGATYSYAYCVPDSSLTRTLSPSTRTG